MVRGIVALFGASLSIPFLSPVDQHRHRREGQKLSGLDSARRDLEIRQLLDEAHSAQTNPKIA
jgi:hypothetical protein